MDNVNIFYNNCSKVKMFSNIMSNDFYYSIFF